MREPVSKRLQGRRILFVVPPARFDESEFYQSWQLLSEEGAWLVAASDAETGVAIGESGAPVRTLRLCELDAKDFDGVILLDGEEDADEMLARAGRFVASALAAGRTVGAFGKIGGELHALGLPVVRNGRHLSRFLAELAVHVSRQPELTTPLPEPAGRA
jgi:hypothetical protein